MKSKIKNLKVITDEELEIKKQEVTEKVNDRMLGTGSMFLGSIFLGAAGVGIMSMSEDLTNILQN